ncbi:MAG: class 1 fructose-bisphosphatase [Myxococcota bacterium]|nr:class 1 fructose-bisphosphatase [Myxococcota bacterium]
MSETGVVRENLTTLRKHLRAREEDGGLRRVLEAVALAGKSIAHKVRRARIDDDVIGQAGAQNTHGEDQQKLDVMSDELVLQCLRECPEVAVYASEERDEALVLKTASEGGRFCVVSDPLDGSSNIDVAVSVGTIFSVLDNDQPDADTEKSALQPGTRQRAAGYILYGSSVVLVLTLGDGVDMYVLDPVVGEFLLVQERLQMPAERKIYSINEAYADDFEPWVRAYLDHAHANGYGSRYIGSMVADVHRTLLKGGVFLYPPTAKAPAGKLRLLYEGSPMAFVVEQAGGVATAGKERLLEQVPEKLHQRTPVILGSRAEVEQVQSHI